MSYPQQNPGANPTSSTGPRPDASGGEGGLQAGANRVHSELQSHVDSINSNAISWTGGAGGDVPQFPAKYLPTEHDADTRVQLKQALAASPQTFGQVIATEEDMRYLLEKRKLGDRLIFDSWFSQLWDTKDINKLRIAQQIHPEYFQMREEEINREAEVQKKIAKIRLRGPADMSDLQLIFALQNGGVQLRNKPIWNIDQADSSAQTQYQRGIFSPARFFTNNDAAARPTNSGLGIIGSNGAVGVTGATNPAFGQMLNRPGGFGDLKTYVSNQ